jgi:hypothetical protein
MIYSAKVISVAGWRGYCEVCVEDVGNYLVDVPRYLIRDGEVILGSIIKVNVGSVQDQFADFMKYGEIKK